MTRRLAIMTLALGLLSAIAFAQGTREPVGTIRGLVFTLDPDGGRSAVRGAKISLDGPSHSEAESNGEGNFAFSSVPPGDYTISVQAPGMAAMQNVVVTAGNVSEVALEMKIQSVAESTTVTATTDQVDTKEASGNNAIGESTVEHVPNRNEHFEDLLPLIPGVVRGPNGRI